MLEIIRYGIYCRNAYIAIQITLQKKWKFPNKMTKLCKKPNTWNKKTILKIYFRRKKFVITITFHLAIYLLSY